jgi:hypothetical protein
MNDIAGQNIRAEEQSEDNFTMRAGPGVIWMKFHAGAPTVK